MLLDGAGEVAEMFRNSFPLSFLFFVPLLILISPVSPAHDFAVYRMQQYDLQGSAHGMTYYTVIIVIIIIIITTIYLENVSFRPQGNQSTFGDTAIVNSAIF